MRAMAFFKDAGGNGGRVLQEIIYVFNALLKTKYIFHNIYSFFTICLYRFHTLKIHKILTNYD